jgi:predicted phosphodiesterase
MHIFKDEKSAIQKYTWRNGDKTIGQQVKESIEANKFPVFISEGTTAHKLKRIKENGYLSRSFSSMKSIKGDIFIFGHSIRNEDDHVFDIINANRSLKKNFISLFGNKDSDENKKIILKIIEWRNEYNFKGR